jgi:coenzyme PQQ precursor peptide PqqA
LAAGGVAGLSGLDASGNFAPVGLVFGPTYGRCPTEKNKTTMPTDNKQQTREIGMKTWKRPVIVEIQVGMEINLYVCAKL